MWSAITDRGRLAQWHGTVEGDLRRGGTFRRYVEADGWEGTGRVEVCESPRWLVVTSRESEVSWRKGQGAPQFEATVDAAFSADGDQTALVVQIGILPLEPLASFGVGWQIHLERLAAYVVGRELGDTETRWDVLVPSYQALAAAVRS
ncbi:MAG: SRPBCC domain-containing protein [Acidimicrobiales bacterium]